MEHLKYLIIPFTLCSLSMGFQFFYNFPAIPTAAALALLVSLAVNDQSLRSLIYISAFCSTGTFFLSENFLFFSAIFAFTNYVLYLKTKNFFIGHGGKLGSLAFISSFTLYLLVAHVF